MNPSRFVLFIEYEVANEKIKELISESEKIGIAFPEDPLA